METFLRTINLVMGSATLTWLLLRRTKHRAWYPKSSLRRDAINMAIFWLLASVVGTCEQLFHTGTYFRVVFVMIAICDTLIVVVRPKQDWDAIRASHREGNTQ